MQFTVTVAQGMTRERGEAMARHLGEAMCGWRVSPVYLSIEIGGFRVQVVSLPGAYGSELELLQSVSTFLLYDATR